MANLHLTPVRLRAYLCHVLVTVMLPSDTLIGGALIDVTSGNLKLSATKSLYISFIYCSVFSLRLRTHPWLVMHPAVAVQLT